MLSINPQDVLDQINLMRGQLIALGIFFVLAIIITVAAVKAAKPARGLVRGTAWMAFIATAVILINQILTGPLYNILNLALGGEGGEIREESITDAGALGESISEEGFVLLKNDGILPLSDGTKINPFGWSSTNPIYGGTGSGSLSNLYATVSLLDSLDRSGIEYNKDLTDFYTGWRTERPAVAMFGQDWTIPEPTLEEYDAAGVFENAKAYSDTAMIVISRSGGEGSDLPTDLDPANDTYSEGEGMGGGRRHRPVAWLLDHMEVARRL